MPKNAPLMSVGLDSLAASEFTSTVSFEMGTHMSSIILFDHPTLESMISYVGATMDLVANSEAAVTRSQRSCSMASLLTPNTSGVPVA